jgi:alpha-L-rhamnosidase
LSSVPTVTPRPRAPHRAVGGLAPAAPGYRRLELRPRPGGGLTHARARHRTPYGLAECAWRIENDEIALEVVVPPNTTARVVLPQGSPRSGTRFPRRARWRRRVDRGRRGAAPLGWPWPKAPPRPLTLDSTLGELVDDPEAWNAALRAAPQLAGTEVGLGARRDMLLRQAFAFRPDGAATVRAVEAALAGLGRRSG